MQPLTVTTMGYAVSAFLYSSARRNPTDPLLVALHGGTYTHEYFNVAGSDAGSFTGIANRNGFDVLAIDRFGYGGSDTLPESDNTFPAQAELLDGAIAELLPATGCRNVVLSGHSIGGMVALEIAARRPPSWGLIGVCATGMGARIPKGGASEALGNMPSQGMVDLPIAEREKLWYGPPGSYFDKAVDAARRSYAPAPMIELANAPKWASSRLDAVAAGVSVPIHHALAEFDALWDSSEDARAAFLSKFDRGLRVESEIVPGVGHCIDHHLAGSILHLKQLAFARECVLKVEC